MPEPADLQPSRDERGVFVALFSLYLIVLYPILRANRYYNDDLKRALFGHTGWDSNGRPLTSFLMKLLQCYDGALVDISPLTQIGAIAILAWTGVLIARRYRIASTWMAVLVAFPLGAQPFYLDNLSYKFDSLSMSLAVFLSMLPVLVLRKGRRDWWLGVLALFASLCFYQPAITVCLVFVVLDVAFAQTEDTPPRRVYERFALQAAQVGLSMLVYQLVVGMHVNGWIRTKSEKIGSLGEIPLLWTNVQDFGRYIADSFNSQWWSYFAPLLLLVLLIVVTVGIGYAWRFRAGRSLWFGCALAASAALIPVAAFVGMFGPMLLLVHPLYAPRVLIGVGALLSASLIVMQAALRRWRRSAAWTLCTAGMLAIGMGVFASVYGNALGEQKAYEDRLGARLADDLAAFAASDPAHAVLFDGSAGLAPITAHILEEFPLIAPLVPSYIAGDDTFHTHIFMRYYLDEFVDLRLATDAGTRRRVDELLATACVSQASAVRSGYRLFLIGDVAVVKFGPARDDRCIRPRPDGPLAPSK